MSSMSLLRCKCGLNLHLHGHPSKAPASPPGRGGCKQWIVVWIRRHPLRALLAFNISRSKRA